MKARLERAKEYLQVAGSVLERKKPGRPSAWTVRYRCREDGRRRYKCIYLGDIEMARRARVLIRRWRSERLTEADRRLGRVLPLLDLSASAQGFSRRARRRLKRAATEAAQDPRQLLRIVVAHPDPHIRAGSRAGRPAKSALW